MVIKEISVDEFQEFVNSSPLGTYYQTRSYALLMGNYGYDYDFIGFINEYNQIKAASLILIKKEKSIKYGYAPRGFILDYFNQELLSSFTEELIKYYRKKHICFIKINPEIAISEVDPKTGVKTYNWNYDIKEILENNGYYKLKDNLYFESILPRFQAVVSLKTFNEDALTKNCRNKIKKGIHKGLHIELSEKSGIDILQRFIEKKKHTNPFYYKDYYNIFHREGMIDLFLVSIDSGEYLINSRKLYEEELERNAILNEELKRKSNKKIINKKMNSDRKLLAYKNDIQEATELNKIKDKIYIAGALVIKYKNRVHILISGYDTKYKNFAPNYFLHYQIMEYYKKEFDYIDLNGMTGDFTKENPYNGLNQFKLGFKPKIYEYIGEYDLPILPAKYKKQRLNGNLAKIFNKPDIKPIKKG
ncbi:TPA: peptidoglycan bridge formation glycyltransferase FemA/FemB family protein [Candidatus Ventrenecus stercoripullorum]|nr:peptidoglycan bridge formation glycyltransferase FemA/FemB family protein [Candidatus Ventrenecus stercoripullorum]